MTEDRPGLTTTTRPPLPGGTRVHRLYSGLRPKSPRALDPLPLDQLPDSAHLLTRKGQELRARVLPLDEPGDTGHALIFGAITDNCLVRLHSRCLYGDALGSQDCDCGPELERTMDLIQQAGAGVLIYLEQEGRGAGLMTKARGLGLCDQLGVDTFTAYSLLGVEPDSRCYESAGRSLAGLGLSSVQLLTNNERKVQALQRAGLRVHAIPLHPRPQSTKAAKYLTAKRRHDKHSLPRHYRSRTLIPAMTAVVASAAGLVAWNGLPMLGGFIALACAAIAAVGITGAH
ncbi:MAG: putative cyclohydrolase [Nocardia sp.]|uniref:GTP cyclohydrolase II RibA n=1 Tax=Nocardia sp. TaxID=1821 RepID=UPI00260EEC68|nr:GTP cyclohydrolase II RibA [Nocardia sp.]MCU1640510.1 putative cyclohydrolase [Nocardia sp.]